MGCQHGGSSSLTVMPAPLLLPLSLPVSGEAMAGGWGVLMLLLALLALQGTEAVKVGNVMTQVDFYQRAETLQQEGGQYVCGFDGDEMFHVDLEKAENVWRLPEFGECISFEAQRAMQNVAADKQNMEVAMKLSNRSQGMIEPPEVTVFSEDPVELGDPNVLICYVDKFWPPMTNITWLKNGQEVVDGVFETVYLSREDDDTFRKFSYLPFVPIRGDYYDCRVEHWGLPKALLKHWEPQVPLPVSESTETLVCALGLAVGIVGIVAGTVLIIKAMKMNSARNARGPL